MDIAKKNMPNLLQRVVVLTPELLTLKFKEISDTVGAKLLVDMAHFSGLVAGQVYPILVIMLML